jgi:predicted NUDIX family NTP pyrophosphohydrolase
MSARSGGILSFRFRDGVLEVMLVHPGGPFWVNKDEGAWSIPKGLLEENESPLDGAKREFREETGLEIDGEFIDLGESKQPSKKIVHAWAIENDMDETKVVSNTFALEWPKKSGIIKEYPEIDKAGWFDVDTAKKKILKGQAGFVDRLAKAINYSPKDAGGQDFSEHEGHALSAGRPGSDEHEDGGGADTPDAARRDRKVTSTQISLNKWSRG